MAKTLEFEHNGTTLDLQGGGSGFQLLGGWQPRIATIRPGHPPARVTEKVPLAARGSSHDNLAVHLQALHAMQVAAVEYIGDRMAEFPVWLHRQMENETGEVRALVREIPAGFESGWYDALSVNSKARVMLPVVREGGWERTTAVSMPAATPAAGAAVVYDYTSAADVVGDVPARLSALQLEAAVGSTIGRLWIGLRSANKHRTLANFKHIWEMEDCGIGDLGTDAAFAADATASPGGVGNTKVTVTPGTATWAKRLSITALDVITAGQEDDNFGRFLDVLRYQVTVGTWEVQFRVGYSGMPDANMVHGPIKEISSTSWDYVEMGVFDYPLRDLHAFPTSLLSGGGEYGYEIQVWARRTAGAGNLDLDCFVPVPVDEGFLWAGEFVLPGRTRLYVAESPEGKMQVLAYDVLGSGITYVAEFAPDNFRLPVGDGRMVIVYADETSSTLTDQIEIKSGSAYYPRWLSLRGAE